MKPDYSVTLTKYLYLNWTSEFEPKYTITELKYNGISPEPEKYVLPHDLSSSWIETDYDKEAVGSNVDDLDCESIHRDNFYVVYGAIDLMNFVYTSIDKNNTILYDLSGNL